LLYAVYIDVKTKRSQGKKLLPYFVLCATAGPVLVVFWLQGFLDPLLLYKLTPLVDGVWVLVRLLSLWIGASIFH